MTLRRIAAVALLALLAPQPARAQSCPGWDLRFGNAQVSDTVRALLAFDDGGGTALYAGGAFTQAGDVSANRVGRWDGVRWSRLLGGANGTVHALAVFDDGNGAALYAAGEFTAVAGVPADRIARWDGQAWSALGLGLNSTVRALAVHDDGGGPALYAGGDFTLAGGASANRVARWNGATWTALAQGASGPVHALASHDAGGGAALYAGGSFLSAGLAPARNVARWNGTSWSILGNGTNGAVRCFATFDDGLGSALYAGGDFSAAGSLPAAHVARWDGAAWSALGTGTDGVVRSLLVHDGGTGAALFAAGSFESAGGSPAASVARWSGGAWSALASGIAGDVHDLAAWPIGGGTRLVAAGRCGLPASGIDTNVLAWDGARWSPLAHGLAESYAHGVIRHDDGSGPRVYVGGLDVQVAGASVAHGMARWDGTGWQDAGPNDTFFRAHAFAEFDEGSGPSLFVVGPNQTAGNVAPNVVNAVGIARWDGASWSAVGGSLGNTAYAVLASDAFFLHALYVGGLFSSAGGLSGRCVARWDGAAWVPLATTVTNNASTPTAIVFTLCEFDDGSGTAIYAGGMFGAIDGVASPNVARWNGGTWSAVGTGLTSPPTFLQVVRALCAYDSGSGRELYAAGIFSLDGLPPKLGLARWNGAVWQAVGTGTTLVDVHSLTVFDDGSGRGPLLLAGTNTSILSWDGTTLATYAAASAQPNESVDTLYTIPASASGPSELWVAGNFHSLAGQPASLLARYVACDETGTLSCFGDGLGTPCPCGNASPVANRAGCLHSQGAGGVLRASGTASLTHDSIELAGTSMVNSSVLYFQGVSQIAGGLGAPFGDGIRCVGGPYVRLGIRINLGGASTYPGPSAPLVSVRGQIAAPGTRHYQAHYRNAGPFCMPDTFNLTNAVSLIWGP